MTKDNDTWIEIAVVGKAAGLSGEFFLGRYEGELAPATSVVRIGKNDEQSQIFGVESVKKKGKRTALKLEGVRSREDARNLLHRRVWVKKDELEVAEGEYLWSDLIGREVRIHSSTVNGQRCSDDSQGGSQSYRVVGKVLGVNDFGAGEVVEIESDAGARILLPFNHTFFDMAFKSGEKHLILIVSLSTIEDLWDEQKS